MINSIKQTADNGQVAGFWDDVKEKLREWYDKDLQEWFFHKDDGVDTTPVVLDDGGTYPADFGVEAQSMEVYEMASTEDGEAPVVNQDLDVTADCSDLNFEGVCAS